MIGKWTYTGERLNLNPSTFRQALRIKPGACFEPEEQGNIAVVNKPAKDGCARTVSDAEQTRIDVHAPAKCLMCGEGKVIPWVNPGDLGPNTETCQDYIP